MPDPEVPALSRRPLVIVGPTASGKSSLAVALARRAVDSGCPAEIVSVDAMAVYRGLDIGTAKPTIEERAGITHHLIDVVEPSDDYTVSRFANDAAPVLERLETDGVVPILVGGTGLYVRAVVDTFEIPGQFPAARSEMEAEPDTEALHRRLAELDPLAATRMEPSNRRRIVRALEVTVGSGRPFSSYGPGVDAYPPTRFCQVGLDIDRPTLDNRIEARYQAQVKAGFLDEVARLAEGSLSSTAGQALGYRELLGHLAGHSTLDEALDEAIRRTRRFARRQQRWFRRDPRIAWFEATAGDLIDQVEAHWLS